MLYKIVSSIGNLHQPLKMAIDLLNSIESIASVKKPTSVYEMWPKADYFTKPYCIWFTWCHSVKESVALKLPAGEENTVSSDKCCSYYLSSIR